MTPLAVSTGIAVLSLIGLLIGLVVAGVIVALFNRVVRPVLEIDRYASDISEGGAGIAANLEGVDELARTRELAAALPALATAYLQKIKGELP